MPYINVGVSSPIPQETEKRMKERLGKAITIIPGKSEQYLMAEFRDNCKLYMAGTNISPSAYVSVNLFGHAPKTAYQALTVEICNILQEELNINPTRIYIQYGETDHWGWNNGNF